MTRIEMVKDLTKKLGSASKVLEEIIEFIPDNQFRLIHSFICQRIEENYYKDNFINIIPGTTLEEAEKQIILETLKQNRGNRTQTAYVLGIGRKTLHRKLNEYGM